MCAASDTRSPRPRRVRKLTRQDSDHRLPRVGSSADVRTRRRARYPTASRRAHAHEITHRTSAVSVSNTMDPSLMLPRKGGQTRARGGAQIRLPARMVRFAAQSFCAPHERWRCAEDSTVATCNSVQHPRALAIHRTVVEPVGQKPAVPSAKKVVVRRCRVP